MADHVLENNDVIDKIKLRKEVNNVKDNYEAEHERNIKDMIQDDEYKSPWKNKDATVATSFKTVNNP